MTVRKGGLGRGLDAMISETAVKPKSAAAKKPAIRTVNTSKKDTEEKKELEGSALMVKMTQIEPNQSQPRKQFDEDALLELSESIKQFGVLQPLLVQKKGDYYEIIAGERRWESFKACRREGSTSYCQGFYGAGNCGDFPY